jgi:hypothetical protein
MKTTLITNTELPGAFSIEAETPEEALILRMFCNDQRPIHIASSGGNIEDNRMYMMIAHSKTTDVETDKLAKVIADAI